MENNLNIEPTKSKSLSLLKDFEFNKINEDVNEELKYLQFKNKAKYMFFWGSLITATLMSHNYVTSNLDSKYQKALIKNGTSPVVALFSTNWDKKLDGVKKDFDVANKEIAKINEELKNIESLNSEYSLIKYISSIPENELIDIIKGSKDYKDIKSFVQKVALVNSSAKIVLNNNEYLVSDILQRLSTLDDSNINEAIKEPLEAIHSLKIIDIKNEDLKDMLIQLSRNNNYYKYEKSLYKDESSILKASANLVKQDKYSMTLTMSLNDNEVLNLADTKNILDKKFNEYLEKKNKDVLKQKEKITKLKKELEDLGNQQKIRQQFIKKINSVTVDNYLENKKEIENLFSEID